MTEQNEYVSPFAPDENDIVDIPANWAYPKLFQSTIKLRNGQVMNGRAQRSPFGNELYVYPEGVDHTYAELAEIFSDPEKTQVIQHNKSESEISLFSGFTQLGSITAEDSGKYTVILRKPE